MHEVGLVEEAIRTAVATAQTSGSTKIDRLTFAIAPGGHVTADAVASLFEALSVGTLAQGAEVAFEDQDGEYGCWSCGHTFAVRTDPGVCPACHGTAISRLDTPDLVLRYVDVPFIAR